MSPKDAIVASLRSDFPAERQRREQALALMVERFEHKPQEREALRAQLQRLIDETSFVLRLLGREHSVDANGEALNGAGRSSRAEQSAGMPIKKGATSFAKDGDTPSPTASPSILHVHSASLDEANGPYTRLNATRNGYASYSQSATARASVPTRSGSIVRSMVRRVCELHVVAKRNFLGWGLFCGDEYAYMTYGCMAALPTTCTWFALGRAKAAQEAANTTRTGWGLPKVSLHARVPPSLRQTDGVWGAEVSDASEGSSALQLWMPLWTMRAHPIGRNSNSRTCAVVGSSGTLLYERFGKEIDSHDIIVRFNDAPTEGFEPIVGGRSSVRVLNTKAAFTALRRCAHAGTCEVKHRSCCPQDATILLNSGRPSVAECFQRACGPAPNIYEAMANHPLVNSLRAESNGTGRIMSGAYGVAIALLLCQKNVTLYGFSAADSTSSSSPSVLRDTPYHYYVRGTINWIRTPASKVPPCAEALLDLTRT